VSLDELRLPQRHVLSLRKWRSSPIGMASGKEAVEGKVEGNVRLKEDELDDQGQ